jgi:arylsulfatase A-like enzyme
MNLPFFCLRQFVVLALGLAVVGIPTEAAPVRPIEQISHVLIISIDGLRPDRALLADTPTLHAMIHAGAYTFWARTTPNSITLPSHVSLLTGVSPRKHGIEWNYDLPLAKPVYPFVPTIFELANNAGYTTALIAGKSKFETLNRPGTVTYAAIPSAKIGDNAWVTAAATRIITEHRPALIFVHYPDVDMAGHNHGWGSPEQLATIESTDRELAQLFAALDRSGLRESTLVLLTADHGGAGRTHGPDDPRSRHIPWIAVGPEVRPNYDLTQDDAVNIRIEDTTAIACRALGLPIPDYFDGQPQSSIFQPAAAARFAGASSAR